MTSLKCRDVNLNPTRIEFNARARKIEVQNVKWFQESPNSRSFGKIKKQQTCLCSYVGGEICFLPVTWYRSGV